MIALKHGVFSFKDGVLVVGDGVLEFGDGMLKLKYKIIGVKRPRFEVKTLPL